MKHKTIEQLIQKSLDCEINHHEKLALDEHLATCPECRRLYETMEGIQDDLSMLTEWYPRVGFNARVMRALGATSRAVWRKTALVFGSIWAASIGALFLLPVNKILNTFMTSIPYLVRIANKIQVVITTISRVLAPLSRITIDPLYPVLGIGISIGMFYIIGRTLHKEEQCKA
jgi:predicted anti-sigma-YlaC factor YlaD